MPYIPPEVLSDTEFPQVEPCGCDLQTTLDLQELVKDLLNARKSILAELNLNRTNLREAASSLWDEIARLIKKKFPTRRGKFELCSSLSWGIQWNLSRKGGRRTVIWVGMVRMYLLEGSPDTILLEWWTQQSRGTKSRRFKKIGAAIRHFHLKVLSVIDKEK